MVGIAVARSGCSSLPLAPALWLVAIRVRSSALYIVKALARYSPVGSKAAVKPKSSWEVRKTPPFWTPPPPQAAATRAIARASPTMPSKRRLLPIIPRFLAFQRWSTVAGALGWGCCPDPPFSPRGGPPSAPFGRAESVAQPVTHQVERERGDDQERALEHHHPPGIGEQLAVGRVGEHAAP